MYPELDQLLRDFDPESKNLSILTDDSISDTHGFFILAHFVDLFIKRDENVAIISYRFRDFELESILSKSGLITHRFVTSKKLQFYTDLDDFLENCSDRKNTIVVLDSPTVILETATCSEFLKTILKAEYNSKLLILRTELSSKIDSELGMKNFLAKRSDFTISTSPISFISKQVHGKIQISSGKSVYQRHYFIKDRVLKLTPVGLS